MPDALRHIFVSPHLDDAVLSAGGLIAALTSKGDRAEVWTVFSRGPAVQDLPPRLRGFGDYDVRRAEDARAVARVGAAARWLDLQERMVSPPYLTSPRDAFHTPSDVRAFRNLQRIERVIDDALQDADVHVYVPLGAGNHVDHVEVTVAALRVLLSRRTWGRLLFYEDFYAADGAARRRHFVTRQTRWTARDAPIWGSVRLGLLLRSLAWAARGPGVDHFVPEAAALVWRSHVAPLAEVERAKIAAVREYRTQVAAFGGESSLTAFLHRAHRAAGGERLWQAVRA